MIIVNNPHNPTGKIWNENDFIQLENILDLYPNVILLSDEVYEYISFEKSIFLLTSDKNYKTRPFVFHHLENLFT